MKRFYIYTLILILFTIHLIKGQETGESPLKASLTYMGDFAGCYYGGIQNGCVYLGMVDLSASFSTNSANLWQGGTIFVNLQNTHNSAPGTELTGDLQVFDNINNGNQTYLYQLWYRQQSGKFWFLTGLHDLNSEFLTGEYTGEFINSSFGIMPVASLNSTLSIFPNTSLAFLAGYHSGRMEIKAGIYEGDPGNPEEDPYNLDVKPDFNNGIVGIIETVAFLKSKKGIHHMVKAGLLIHTGNPSWVCDSNNIHQDNFHAYVTSEHCLFSRSSIRGSRDLNLFIQSGLAPANRNLNDFYFSAGLKYTGLFTGKSTESAGIAFAHASISNSLVNQRGMLIKPSETAIEFFYRANLSPQIFIQPDLQYIINPGINPDVRNALAGILRIGIIL